MIATDYQFIDVDSEHWVRLLRFFFPSREPSPPGTAGKGAFLFLLLREGRLLKAVHSEKGVMRNYSYHPGESLGKIAVRNHVERVIATEEEVLSGLIEEVRRGFRIAMPIHDPWLLLLRGCHRYWKEGRLRIHPVPRIRYPHIRALQQALRLVFPNHVLLCAYVFDCNKLYSSLIIGIENRELRLVTTHDTFLARGRDVPASMETVDELVHAIEAYFSPLDLGLFTERSALEDLSNSPGRFRTLRRMIRRRQLVLVGKGLPGKLMRVLMSAALLVWPRKR